MGRENTTETVQKRECDHWRYPLKGALDLSSGSQMTGERKQLYKTMN